MNDYNRSLKTVIICIFILGTLILVFLGHNVDLSRENLIFMATFSIIALALMNKPIAITTSLQYSLEDVIAYAVIFLKGPSQVVWVFFISSMIHETYKFFRAWKTKKGQIRPFAVAINFSNPFTRIIIAGLAGMAFVNLKNWQFLSQYNSNINWQLIIAHIGCILVFFLSSSLLGTLLIASRSGLTYKNTVKVWKESWSMISPHLLMLAPLGILLAQLYTRVPAAALLLLIPIYIMHTSIESIRGILKESISTVGFMATTLDERDAYTYGHSERVSRYSAALAARLNLPAQEVEKVKNAGLIHDLGKITIPDSVLRKASHLDDVEFDVMKSHTHAPIMLFRSFTLLSRVVPLQAAMYHHERYDGEGYVFGLKGEEIPLVSRILAVADTYDAITSDRPYRKRLPEEEARVRIQEASGTQLDPKIVDIFIEMSKEKEFEKIREEYEESLKKE
ncbi:MAG: HD-GYP domain-containing protein [Vulcanimicrobiota bacterium]